MNLPNRLTVARLVMVPVFVVFMSINHEITYLLAYLIFIAATYTDYLDGKIARSRGLITNFGKLMDPLADKVLMAAALIMLMNVQTLAIPPWTIVAILAREFLVTGARSMAASEGKVIAANNWGKTKTIIQMVYIYTFLFLALVSKLISRWLSDYSATFDNVLYYLSYGAIIFVAAFTVYSGLQFARTNWSALNLGGAT